MTVNSWSNFLALDAVLEDLAQYEQRFVNNAEDMVQYIGYCKTPGGSTSEPIWFIRAVYYDSNNFINYIKLPNMGVGFFYIWDNAPDYF